MYVATALATMLAVSSPEALIEKVQGTYAQGGDLQASFTHTYVDKLRGKQKPENGTLWARQDGRVRWSYRKPTRKDFVYDGKAGYFYEPDNAQLTIYEDVEEHPLWNAVRFLWGQGNITELFDVTHCQERCLEAASNVTVLELTPKQPLASVERALLMIDVKKHQVLRSVLYDALGNRTEYAFENVLLGAKIPESRFKPPPKQGVSILRANPGAGTSK